MLPSSFNNSDPPLLSDSSTTLHFPLSVVNTITLSLSVLPNKQKYWLASAQFCCSVSPDGQREPITSSVHSVMRGHCDCSSEIQHRQSEYVSVQPPVVLVSVQDMQLSKLQLQSCMSLQGFCVNQSGTFSNINTHKTQGALFI